MSIGRRRALEGGFATFALFTLIAGQFWRNLLGWWGFGAIALLVLGGAVWLWTSARPRVSWRRVPKSTIAFLLVATSSIAWSNYPATSVLGVVIVLATTFAGVSLALSLGWHGFLRALASALKWVLGLSLLFELWVALFVREPLLPNFVDHGDEKVPMAFYWSRALLFDGGPIEGIVASRNLLGMAALLALILFTAMYASGSMRRAPGIGWIVTAGLVFALTRSATVILVSVAVLVALAFAVWARKVGPTHRRRVYVVAAGTVVAAAALLALSWNALLALFGKGDDLTGRLDIWESVVALIAERPFLGWGWVGYWAPWAEPYDGLAVRKGVEYLQAHNAWLDVWLQVGVLGLIAFASIVIGALWRSWFLAIDPPRDARGAVVPYSAISLVPLLAMVALIGQSLAESRLLIEGGWVLLIAIAWGTKRRQWSPDALPPLPRPRAPLQAAPPEARP
ncbi:O-antigen ligase family protein [Agromyces sp. GXS1127]|uniref:O-antigen ligase family protein n=1 Tax=Agromyces sp. GXS1127 TaxID=3424181 RepID=UPI003D320F44